MGCCGDEESQKNKGLHFIRSKDRSCTDIFFFLLFIAAAIGSAMLVYRAYADGADPYAATHGQDFRGETCSSDRGAKFSAWPIIPLVNDTTTVAQAEYYFAIKVCVTSCDDTNDPNNPWFDQPYESFKFWRFCIPKVFDASSVIDFSNQPTFQSGAETASQFMSDLWETWWVILASVGFAILVGFLYAKLMSIKLIRTTLVWSVIFFVLAACAVLSWLLLDWSKTAQVTPLDTINRPKAARITGWVMVGVTCALFLIIFFLRKRINYALRVIGSTSSALSQMRSVFIYPIVPIFFASTFLCYWVFVTLCIFTVQTPEFYPLPAEYDQIPGFAALSDKTFAVLQWNKDYQYFFAYHFFHLLWVVQFFIYAGYMTIAGALGQWFFARPRKGSSHDKERGGEDDQLPWFPLIRSALRVIRFHIGTIAFASLIIAIFQFARAVITYIQTKTKGKDNRAIRCILCCLKCILRCIQKCIDYVSRNALVVVAISGDNFCKSACTAFGLLTSNILRVAAFNVIGTFVLFIGKLFISILTTTCAGILITRYYTGDRAENISSPIIPIVVIFIISWLIASTFMHIYSVSLECMFMCYLSDKEGKFTPEKIYKTFQMTEERQKKLQELEEAQLEVKNREKALYEEQYGKKDKKDKKDKKETDKTNQVGSYNNSSGGSAELSNPYA